MKTAGTSSGTALLLVLSQALAAEPPPAQPLAEAEVASTFASAAPGLFSAWFARRAPGAVSGYQANPLPYSGPADWCMHFEFIECAENVPPTMTRIDVQRTDSLLTPFIGLIYVALDESCVARRAVPAKASWKQKAFDRLAPHCIGKRYDECIAAGAYPAPKLMGSACTGGPETRFLNRTEAPLEYGWSQGTWQFQSERRPTPQKPAR